MSEQTETLETEVREHAVKLLARREHAPFELVRKLTQRGHDRAVAERIVDTLAAENLVSASRYAESVARARAQRGQGPQRIRAELSSVDVDDADIEAALEAVDMDWYESARAVRHKRFGGGAPANRKEYARQMRFLQQRGFTSEQIRAALDGS